MQSLLVASAARQVAGLETAKGLYKDMSRAVTPLDDWCWRELEKQVHLLPRGEANKPVSKEGRKRAVRGAVQLTGNRDGYLIQGTVGIFWLPAVNRLWRATPYFNLINRPAICLKTKQKKTTIHYKTLFILYSLVLAC